MDIAAWLRELGLERYETAFRNNDIDFDLLSDLTEADLERLGVVSLGHRKKLLRAIEALRAPGPEVDTPPINLILVLVIMVWRIFAGSWPRF